MPSLFKHSLTVAGCLVLATVASQAATLTFDFGTGTNVLSTWPGSAAGASSSAGIILPYPFLLDAGELAITTSTGVVVCAQSTTVTSLCANTAAYGLGVPGGAQTPRIDPGESLTLTLAGAGYTAALVSFAVTGFNGTERGQYSIDGGAPVVFNPPAGTFTLPTSAAFSTVVWSVPAGNTGNYTLSRLTLDVEFALEEVPEPASLGLTGLVLAGLALARYGAGASRRRVGAS